MTQQPNGRVVKLITKHPEYITKVLNITKKEVQEKWHDAETNVNESNTCCYLLVYL